MHKRFAWINLRLCRLKSESNLACKSRGTLKPLSLFLFFETMSKLNLERSVKFNVVVCRSSPDNVQIGHITLSYIAEADNTDWEHR